jgi:hypothetical protein
MMFEHAFNEISDCACYGCPAGLWEFDISFDIVPYIKWKRGTQAVTHKTAALCLWKQNK